MIPKEPEHEALHNTAQISLLIPVKAMPNGRTVRKATGDKPYVVRRIMKVHGDKPQYIMATEGTVFLVDRKTGEATSVPGERLVKITGSVATIEKALTCFSLDMDPNDEDDDDDEEDDDEDK